MPHGQEKSGNQEKSQKTEKNVTYAGLPHGQEKSGKTKKNDKSQVKMGVFEKSQEIFLLKLYHSKAFKNKEFCKFN